MCPSSAQPLTREQGTAIWIDVAQIVEPGLAHRDEGHRARHHDRHQQSFGDQRRYAVPRGEAGRGEEQRNGDEVRDGDAGGEDGRRDPERPGHRAGVHLAGGQQGRDAERQAGERERLGQAAEHQVRESRHVHQRERRGHTASEPEGPQQEEHGDGLQRRGQRRHAERDDATRLPGLAFDEAHAAQARCHQLHGWIHERGQRGMCKGRAIAAAIRRHAVETRPGVGVEEHVELVEHTALGKAPGDVHLDGKGEQRQRERDEPVSSAARRGAGGLTAISIIGGGHVAAP